jgi:hypothetical protein
MNRTFFAFALFAPLSVLACDKSGTEAQKKADQAQAEANREMNQAQSESTTKITSAQVEADKKIAEAQRSFAQTREDYRHDVQENIDQIDQKLANLEARSKKAVGKKKLELDSRLPGLRSRRDQFVRDAKVIDTETATTFDATKARLDKEWVDLKAAVDKLD